MMKTLFAMLTLGLSFNVLAVGGSANAYRLPPGLAQVTASAQRGQSLVERRQQVFERCMDYVQRNGNTAGDSAERYCSRRANSVVR